MKRLTSPALLALLAVVCAAAAAIPQIGEATPPDGDGAAGAATAGQRIYGAACAACHGHDGRGVAPSVVGFAEALPDFTDCNFVTREPAADWYAVAHDGGPVRAFSRMMPAFGEALSREELTLAVDHIHRMCREPRWPRGELNLPRPMFTEKAYPEDEAVLETRFNWENERSWESQLIYEQRVGARDQLEVVIPFGWVERDTTGRWVGSLGDVALAWKRVLAHSSQTGTIGSFVIEARLPTGKERFGGGTPAAEPFLVVGQLLPADSFVQAQAGLELPFASADLEQEAFWRVALGTSFSSGEFGRTWSPMIEVLGARGLDQGADTHWALAPQFQVTLPTRQHIMANLAVHIPLESSDTRPTDVLLYLLWDWFDGGLLEGW